MSRSRLGRLDTGSSRRRTGPTITSAPTQSPRTAAGKSPAAKIARLRQRTLVDVLAGNVLGAVIAAHPDSADILDAWIIDPDFWVRRAALLAQLAPLKNGAPFERFAGYADAMLDDREFFIRKAIGWVLRETAKQRPDEVREWLIPRAHRVSGVTMREAVKYLPDDNRWTAE